jgi:tetratricopeptide (TPR) repeat protein
VPSTRDDRSDQIERLEAAVRLAPESARLHVDLALAYYDLYKEQRKKEWINTTAARAAQAFCDLNPAWSPPGVPHAALSAVPTWVLTSAARNELCKGDEQRMVGRYLVPALRCFLHARDLCPLLPEPHRFLMEHRQKLARADPLIAYLERLKLLVPYSAGLWYECGQELLDKQPDQAWKNWRHCLELSDAYRARILEQVAVRLRPREILDRVLPSDSRILLAAALQLYHEPTEERQIFLGPALALLEQQPTPTRPADLHLKASIQSALGQADEALVTYHAALTREPRQISWRFEFAQLLYQQKRFQEARRELLIVLLQQAGHTDARGLLTTVERQIAKAM